MIKLINLLKEIIPQSGVSSGAPAKFKPKSKPKIKELTLSEILQQISGIPYYKEVLDDIKKGDESWEVTKKVKEYAEYLKENPSSINNLPPIIVIDKKIQDGAHRISAIYLLSNFLDTKGKWDEKKLKVNFYKKEDLDPKTLKSTTNLKELSLEEQKILKYLLNEKCWKGYTQKGMKKMFGKKYPNCVKK